MSRLRSALLLGVLAACGTLAQAGDAPSVQTLETRPCFFLTGDNVVRLRRQAQRPELAAAYARLEAATAKSSASWLKCYPATITPRTSAELVAIGRRDHPWRDQRTIATAFALHPTPELARVLREKLLCAIGERQIKGYWRPSGIHEGEAAMAFLEAYDLIAQAGVLTPDDRQAVREELRRCAHYLEGWVLDNRFSQGYMDYFRTVYCLNFHLFAASTMGCIAMYFPELPEAAEWQRLAQTGIPRLLFTEFGNDGGYGEGSLHYWHPTFRALLQFMIAARNRGQRDLLADPAIAEAMRRTLAWRMDLTSPDGRSVAVGDGDRDGLGAEYLLQGGRLFSQPSFTWTGRAIIARTRPDLVSDDAYDLFQYDCDAPATQPAATFAHYPFSGYGMFRSGWGAQDHFCYLKYGTTWIGRRENERGLVISGHAHADALHLELHHRGIPVTVDAGRVGRYQDWDTYGGYCKATVAHNTVGIGNSWGYDRLDGLFAAHVRQHGQEFLYETSQSDIGRADTELVAAGDTGAIGILSARLRTYPTVTHQRTVVWFRDSGMAVVHDRLDSANVQPYEWYLNSIGSLIARDRVLTFGDDIARLDIIPILPEKPKIQILAKGDANVPPYYVALRPDAPASEGRPARSHEAGNRWGRYSLLVMQEVAASTAFLNVLVPYEKTTPMKEMALGARWGRLTGTDATILVAAQGQEGAALQVDGEFGVARTERGAVTGYVLHHGHGLCMGTQTLIQVHLQSEAWAPHFDSAVTAAVSLADRRASFSLPLSPMDRGLIRHSPKITPGQEPPLPTEVAVTFLVDAKPRRLVALRSATTMPSLDDAESTRTTASWNDDPHKPYYLRTEPAFTWDETRKTVTVILDLGIRQLVWE